MKTTKRIPIAVFITCLIVAVLVTFMTTYVILGERFTAALRQSYLDAAGTGGTGENEKLSVIDAIYRRYYYHDLDEDALAEYLIRGYVVGTGDRYGAYFNEEEYAAMTASNNAEMQGIGISVIHNTDYGLIEVINVMPDSPALHAGMQPGDLIAYVGEEKESVAALGYTMAMTKLQGKAGTTAVFTVLRGKDYSEAVDFSIERGYVTEVSVLYHLYAADPTIGIIKITGFDLKTPEQFIAAVEDLRSQGATRLVYDVRYNPGGDLTSITEILDFLLPEGPIIRMLDKAGNAETNTSDANELDMPMAVLCNGSTASAAELFTSALKDYGKAVVVGKTTYGKGSMQSILPLGDGTALKLTTKMYFPPFSDSYEGVGIQPDVDVEMDEALAGKNIYKITDDEDTQLQAAIAWLNANT